MHSPARSSGGFSTRLRRRSGAARGPSASSPPGRSQHRAVRRGAGAAARAAVEALGGCVLGIRRRARSGSRPGLVGGGAGGRHPDGTARSIGDARAGPLAPCARAAAARREHFRSAFTMVRLLAASSRCSAIAQRTATRSAGSWGSQLRHLHDGGGLRERSAVAGECCPRGLAAAAVGAGRRVTGPPSRFRLERSTGAGAGRRAPSRCRRDDLERPRGGSTARQGDAALQEHAQRRARLFRPRHVGRAAARRR